MALKDKLDREVPSAGTPCSVGHALKSLPAGELEVFIDLLGTPEHRGKSAAYIYGMMQDERRELYAAASAANESGDRAEAARLQDLAEVYDIGHQTINRHRGRKCRCFKDAA
jgi:hypothetical protein